MLAFLKLVRLPNLIIISLTMYMVRFFLIAPLLQMSRLSLLMTDVDFALLVCSTVLVAAAGYIINDYFDTRIDAINKPGQVVVGIAIKRRVAMAMHIVFNFIAIAAGIYLGYKIGVPKLGLIHVFSAVLLWFYAVSFKKKFVVGNLVIALLSALVIVLPGLFELNKTHPDHFKIMYANFVFILGYAGFAFVISLIREIIKDVEDTEGDAVYGCTTLPIVLGTQVASYIVVVLITLLIAMLGYIQYAQYVSKDMLSFWYFLAAVQLPLFVLAGMTLRATEKKQFTRSSILAKCIMLSGIFSMYIFYRSLLPLIT